MNKSYLKRLALELRSELNLSAHDPFDPYTLAELYGVEIYRISDLACSGEAMDHFFVTRPEVFSGALVLCSDGSIVIVENDSHVRERRVSTASHEMAHVVLEHPFIATLNNTGGCRVMNRSAEDEAAELSGELLLPTDAARHLAFRGVSDEEAARLFGVSVVFARWRMNATGARKIAERAQARRSK